MWGSLDDAIRSAILIAWIWERALDISCAGLPSQIGNAARVSMSTSISSLVTYSYPETIRFSPSGRYIAIAYEGAGILVLDASGRVVARPVMANDFYWCSGDRILVSRFAPESRENTIRGWEIYPIKGKEVAHIPAPSEFETVLAWSVSPDGRYLACTGTTKRRHPFSKVVVFDLSVVPRRILNAPFAFTFGPNDLFWSADGKQLWGRDTEMWCITITDGAVQRFRITDFYATPRVASLGYEWVTDGHGVFLISEQGYAGKAGTGNLVLCDARTNKKTVLAKGSFAQLRLSRSGLFVCKQRHFRDDYPQVMREVVWVGKIQNGCVTFLKPLTGDGKVTQDVFWRGQSIGWIGRGVPLRVVHVD